MNTPHVVIDFLGGNCPVQGEGTINGVPFYFRSRGEWWSMGIGGDVVGDPDWEYSEPCGIWPDAGWITVEQADGFIRQAAAMWFSDLATPPSRPSAGGEA